MSPRQWWPKDPHSFRWAHLSKKKDQGLSKKFAEATAIDEAAQAKDPESVGKDKGAVYEFEKLAGKAFVKVAQQTMTIDEIIKQGLFYGARLDTKAIEAAKQAEK